MRRTVLYGAFVSLLIAGTAHAQTSYSQTTTTTTTATPSPPVAMSAPLPPPPPGTLSTSRTEYTVQPDGTRTKTDETTFHNTAGVADDKVTHTVTVPPPVTSSTTDYSTTTTVIKK